MNCDSAPYGFKALITYRDASIAQGDIPETFLSTSGDSGNDEFSPRRSSVVVVPLSCVPAACIRENYTTPTFDVYKLKSRLS